MIKLSARCKEGLQELDRSINQLEPAFVTMNAANLAEEIRQQKIKMRQLIGLILEEDGYEDPKPKSKRKQ